MSWLRLRRWLRRRQCHHPLMQRYLATALPSPRVEFCAASFLVVDLETTALKPDEGEIASIAWVPIERGVIALAGAEHRLVKVEKGVGQSAIYHQLLDDQLSGAATLREAMDAFLAAASGRTLVFHHAGLDLAFLNQACQAIYGAPPLAYIVDTLQLERNKLMATVGHIESGALRLHACRRRYGLPEYAAHDALVDALATAELLLAQVSHRGKGVRLTDLL